MFLLLKLIRLAITGICGLVLFASFRADDFVGLIMTLVLVGFVLSILWLVPLVFRHQPPRPPKFRDGFTPAVAHDNIALDTGQNILWIRDPVRGERYLRATEVMGARTAYDWRNGTFRQRIEVRVNDVVNPQYIVLFERHSDRWIKTSRINGVERDNWFDRLQVWAGLASIK